MNTIHTFPRPKQEVCSSFYKIATVDYLWREDVLKKRDIAYEFRRLSDRSKESLSYDIFSTNVENIVSYNFHEFMEVLFLTKIQTSASENEPNQGVQIALVNCWFIIVIIRIFFLLTLCLCPIMFIVIAGSLIAICLKNLFCNKLSVMYVLKWMYYIFLIVTFPDVVYVIMRNLGDLE